MSCQTNSWVRLTNCCGVGVGRPDAAPNKTRRRGVYPSPRSWPRICSCKCSGWHFEEMPGEVRPVAEGIRRRQGPHGDYLQGAPIGLRLIFLPCSNVPHLPHLLSQMLDDLASRGHPKHLLRKCGASFVERDSRRIVASPQENPQSQGSSHFREWVRSAKLLFVDPGLSDAAPTAAEFALLPDSRHLACDSSHAAT